MNKITQIVEFLYESNLIENEPDGIALMDAVRAWDYITSKDTLSVSDILSTHGLLMENLNPRIAGKFRNVNVYVGGRAGANPASVAYMLNDLVKKVPETAEEAKQWHIEFEHIHPFEDGNGRTGRIIYNWHLSRRGWPIHIIHEGEEQMDYYNWFQE